MVIIEHLQSVGNCSLLDSWDDAVTMETVNGDPTNSIVANLHPATHYLFRLFAENELGRSKPSQVLRVSTNEDGNRPYCSITSY